MADEETCASPSVNAVFDSVPQCDEDKAVHSTSDPLAVACSCAETTSCNGETIVTPSSCLETSARSVPSGDTHSSDILSPVDAVSDVVTLSSKCQLTDGCVNAPVQASPQLTVCSASSQEPASTHCTSQEIISAESTLSCTTDSNSNTAGVVTHDDCNSFSEQTVHSHMVGLAANSAPDEAANNVEETRKNSVEAGDFSSPVTYVGHLSVDQTKSGPAAVSTPESQSFRCSIVQSSLHGTRQIKCRKTGHRRITANGANLSLGQLINAVSESCLNDSLDPSYIPTSSLSNAAEHRTTTPVKASDAADSSVIKEKLFRHYDNESTCSIGSPVGGSISEASGSPQVVDGVRRPPRARKSCHSNDNKVGSDFPKEPSNSPGTPFGSVRLAELVDAQSLDKLDVRTFDEMLLAKMRDRMRPSNGFKLLLHNNEQSQLHGAVSPEGTAGGISNNKMHDLGSGMPLIPSTAKSANSDNSSRTDAVRQQDKQVVRSNSFEVPGPASRKRVWRCRKSNWSLGNAHRKVNKTSKQPHRDDVTVTGPATRRSPRSVTHSPSLGNSDQVGKCDRLICLIVSDVRYV